MVVSSNGTNPGVESEQSTPCNSFHHNNKECIKKGKITHKHYIIMNWKCFGEQHWAHTHCCVLQYTHPKQVAKKTCLLTMPMKLKPTLDWFLRPRVK